MSFTRRVTAFLALIFLISPVYANETQLEKLLRKLWSEDDQTSFAAAQSIVALGEQARSAVPELIERIRYFPGESMTRSQFISLIANMGHGAVAGSIAVLRDGDIEARRIACRILGSIGPNAKDAIPTLMELMSEPGHDISHAAARSLGAIGEPAVPHLLEILRSDDEDLKALVTHISVRAVPPELNLEGQLLRIIQDASERPSTQKSAIDALRSLQLKNVDKVVTVLVKKLGESEGNVGSSAAHTLGRIGPVAAAEVMKIFKSSNPVARSWATYAIKFMHPPIEDAVPSLIELLQDKEVRVRIGAKGALERIGTAEALEALQKNQQ